MCCHQFSSPKYRQNPLAPSPPVLKVLAASVKKHQLISIQIGVQNCVGCMVANKKSLCKREFQVFWWWLIFFLGKKKKVATLTICQFVASKSIKELGRSYSFSGPQWIAKRQDPWPDLKNPTKKRWHKLKCLLVMHINEMQKEANHLSWCAVGFHVAQQNKLPGTGEAKTCQIYPNLKELISSLYSILLLKKQQKKETDPFNESPSSSRSIHPILNHTIYSMIGVYTPIIQSFKQSKLIRHRIQWSPLGELGKIRNDCATSSRRVSVRGSYQ